MAAAIDVVFEGPGYDAQPRIIHQRVPVGRRPKGLSVLCVGVYWFAYG